MKILVISTALILAMPTTNNAYPSFGSAADRNVGGTNPKMCQSIPVARPAGKATRERLQAMQQCNTKAKQFTKEFNTEVCSPSITEPTGAVTRERLQARQRCHTGIR